MRRITLAILVFVIVLMASEDFSYKPYPVLVIHGLANGPWTVGFKVDKHEDDVFKCIHECYNYENHLAPNHFCAGVLDWKNYFGDDNHCWNVS